jgi:cysteine sulfinate desulfinase/cysteine desulfurase-like protein
VIYLDHNATTPIRPEVLDAMMPYLGDARGDPSSSHRFGAKLKGVIETARAQVAELIGASAREIVFAGSATGANNAAIHAALKANPGKRHNVTSAVEHSSVLNYCMALEGHREWTRIHTNQPQAATRRREEAQEAAVGGSGRESAASDSPKDQSRLTSAATKWNEGAGIPNTELNGHKSQRLANTTNIAFHGIESEALLLLLDQEGICASSGSACLADSDEPSHVVKDMKPESAASRQMIRFTLGLESTAAEVKAALNATARAVKVLRG